jgi:hypothetical protein
MMNLLSAHSISLEIGKNYARIGMVESERRIGQKVTTQVRYSILSIEGNVATFSDAVRDHWGIENEVLMSFLMLLGARISLVYAQVILLIILLFCGILHLTCAYQEKTANGGIHTKRLKAGWSTNYFEKVLIGDS